MAEGELTAREKSLIALAPMRCWGVEAGYDRLKPIETLGGGT